MYKNKYLKYKNKYLDLKNQLGGSSQFKLNLDEQFNRSLQNSQSNTMVLDSKEDFNVVKNHYMTYLQENLLDKLMEYTNNEYNVDFINGISAMPFYSTKFNINYSSMYNTYSFVDSSLNYTISATKVLAEGGSGGGGGYMIIFLKRNDEKHGPLLKDLNYPEYLILKLFIDNDQNNYSPLVISEIMDNSTNVPSYDNRYQSITTEDFHKYYNLDPQYSTPFIEITRQNKVFLGVPLSDFKNEMVQNIILNKILSDQEDLKENLIQYYNFLNIGINGLTTNYYKGIIMERIDKNLYERLQEDETLLENADFQEYFNNYITSIAYVKNNVNRFTHTDLKTQNVFMQKNNKCLIADLDKSSITYNGIRFYNNKFTGKTIDYKQINKRMEQITKSEDNEYLVLPKFSTRELFERLELEQATMRYSIFPFAPYFDFLVLYAEIKYLISIPKRLILDSSAIHNYLNAFQKSTSGLTLKDLTVVSEGGGIVHSNFGDIVWNLLIMNQTKIPLMTTFETKPYLVKTVKLLTAGNIIKHTKLALSDKLIIKNIIRKKVATWLSGGEYEIITNNDVKILYTGDFLNVPKEKQEIYKVNRFSLTTKEKLGMKVIVEYILQTKITEYLPTDGGGAAVDYEPTEGGAAAESTPKPEEPEIGPTEATIDVPRTGTNESSGSQYFDAESGDE
jgi:hypothetical protein